MNLATIRTRWAAVGAAVAVSLGAGGIGLISAAPLSTGERPVLVPVNCRLADTRPAPDTVGTRSTPLGAGETVTFNAHGTNGNCTIPADATALLLNVTALNITAPLTFLTLWNADQTQPLTSSLNPAAGQPPTPNAVTVDLSATGQFKLFNALGTLNVIIDVTGYYQDHNHDDRYYTEAEINAIVDAPTTPAGIADAVGLVDSTGSLNSGSANIASTTWNASLNRYEITFSNFGFFFSTDVALVTPAGTGSDITATTSSVGGTTLLVFLKNGAGTPVQSDFSFVVWNTGAES
jgi:hypothetical protein